MKTNALGLVLVTLLTAACAPKEVRVEVSIAASELPDDMKVELYADGVPARLLRTARNDSAFAADRIFEIPVMIDGDKKKIPALKLRALFACGWREQTPALEYDPPVEMLRAAAAGRRQPSYFTTVLQPFAGKPVVLWVDNRSGGSAELGLGDLKFPIPAGKATAVRFVTCDTPIPVTFGGESMGEISLPQSFGLSSAILLDPTGKRCYVRRTVRYALDYERWTGGGSGGESESMSKKRLHYTKEGITYLFEKPPEKIEVIRNSHPEFGVLDDAKCS